MIHAILWFVIAFGPTIAVAVLGIRAARSRDVSAWADFRDVATVLDWFTAPLIVVTAPLLVGPLSDAAAALACAVAMLLFRVAISAFSPRDLPLSTRARLALAGSGGEIGMGIYLIGCALTGDLQSLAPSARLYLALMWASFIGHRIMWRIAWSSFRQKPLAPGALSDRIREIAHRRGVKIEHVTVIKSVPGYTDYVNALAAHGTTIVLFADLIAKLDRAEVDAVVEHEMGHIADERIWTLDTSIRYGLYLVMLALAFGVEKGIAGLPGLGRVLLYAMWITLFAIPEVLSRCYSRRIERRANQNMAHLTDPLSVISAEYKLTLLNHHPVSRPLWSRLVSTHPCTDEIVAEIAGRTGLSDEQLRATYERATAAVASRVVDGYELTTAGPTGAAIAGEPTANTPVPRPAHRAGCGAAMLSAVVGIVSVVAFMLLLVAVISRLPVGPAILAGFLGFVGCVLAFILPVDRARRRRDRRLRELVRDHLESRYGSEALANSLLVDALFPDMMDQDQPWQGALVNVNGGRLVLRGETTELAVSLDREISASRYANNGASGSDALLVMICYRDGDVLRTVFVRILGLPERGVPRNWKQLEKHIKGLLTDAGTHTVSVKSMLGRRNRKLKWSHRVPVAACIYLAILALADYLARAFGGGVGTRVMWCTIATSLAGRGLWAWVTQAHKPDDN